MTLFRVLAGVAILLLSVPATYGQTTYSTGFEPPTFVVGDVNGQDGWGHISNSPTRGAIVLAPVGAPAGSGLQSLQILTRDVGMFGVSNHLFSATLNPGAGETNSTAGTTMFAAPPTNFQASFWFRTPAAPVISTRPDGVFAELDPSSKGYVAGDVANRYARVRLINTTNTAAGFVRVQMGWYQTPALFLSANVAELAWDQWYRFEYNIQLVDGIASSGEANDRFVLTIFNAAGTQVGSGCGSTWELPYRVGAFGGTATPRNINGFDFWSLTGPNDTIVGHIDQFSMSATSPAVVPVTATISGTANVCAGGTTTLTAGVSGGTGTYTTYVWRDAGNAVVGTAPTLVAGAGSYTVSVTDSFCVTGTSPAFVVSDFAPLAVAITGNTNVCFGGTTALSAAVSGGSGTITGYEWRDASNAVVGTSPTLTAGAGTYTVTVTDASCGLATSAPATVQVTCKATPVVTWSNPADIIYGTPLTSTQLNATANVPGTFTYNPPAGTVLNAGPSQILSVDFAPTDSANYDNVNGTTVRINVLPATPVVTWADPANIVYGTPLSATQLNATANVPGTFVYTPPAGTVLSAGPNQILSVDFQPADSTNYLAVNGTTVQITVDKAPTTISITAIDPSPSIVGQPVRVSFSVGGLIGVAGGTVTITDGVDSCSTSVATQSCTLTLTSAGGRIITATYSGDANHHGSASAGKPHFVDDQSAVAMVEGSTTICEGASAVVRVHLTGTGPWNIVWSDGVAQTATATPHERLVQPAVTTMYSIASFSDQNGTGGTAGFALITVNSVVPPAIISSATPEIGEPFTLQATPGYASYQWYRNGSAISGATAAQFHIASVTPSDLATYTVTGTNGGCVSDPSAAYSLVPLALPDNEAVIPVVGNTRGANGSLFRTTVHLVNGTDEVMQGEITFIAANLPLYPYTLMPGETRFITDLLPPEFSGLTSANVRRLRGPLPVTVVHVFNDGEEEGTSGLIERVVPAGSVLTAGDQVVLITPIDPVATRFNLGIRSLTTGLRTRMTRRRADGTLVETVERTLPPSTLLHEVLPSGSSDSLTFDVLEGSGVIYGAATDNGTNDPNMQIATRVAGGVGQQRYVLPVAGAVTGAFNSQFATGLQIHNPSDSPIDVMLTFRGEQHLTVTIPARATRAFADLVASMEGSGMGGLDVSTAATVRPVIVARIYSIAAEGQTSASVELIPDGEVLTAGDEGVLAAPHAPLASRFNIGIRTLSAAVRITATIREADGDLVKVVPLSFPASFFGQNAAGALLDVTFNGDESVVFHIDEGSAVIYGVWTDNVTQDVALQYAVRP